MKKLTILSLIVAFALTGTAYSQSNISTSAQIPLPNNLYMGAVDRTSISRALIGMNRSNLVSIDPDAQGAIAGGDFTVTGNLAVTGNQTFTGNLAVTGTLGVTGLATFSAGAAITGAATVSTTLGVTGVATFTNKVVINGGAGDASLVLPSTGRIYLNGDSAASWLEEEAANNWRFVLAGVEALDLTSTTAAFNPNASAYTFRVHTQTSGEIITGQTGSVVINEGGSDTDFRWESDTISNGFVLDAGLFNGVGGIGIGFAANGGGYVHLNNPAMTAAGSTSFGKIWINNSGGAVTIPAGTTAVGATLRLEEPNFTVTGTLTLGATVYINGAPTEGGINHAIHVASGNSQFNGDLDADTFTVAGVAGATAACDAATAITLNFTAGIFTGCS
jgi:hypothetical protein